MHVSEYMLCHELPSARHRTRVTNWKGTALFYGFLTVRHRISIVVEHTLALCVERREKCVSVRSK